MTEVGTEEELKRVLKTLFAEKKRVKELQKEVDKQSLHKKFYTKLAHLHTFPLAEEHRVLKEAVLQKDQEIAELKDKLVKIGPAIKKLVDELKRVRAESVSVPQPNREEVGVWKEKYEQVAAKCLNVEQEKEKGEGERHRLVERLSESVQQVQQQLEITHSLREELLQLQSQVEKGDLQAAQDREKIGQLEEHVALSQRLSETNQLLKEQLRVSEEKLDQERHTFSMHMREWAQQEKELYGQIEKLERMREELENNDLTSVREEYEAKALAQEALTAVTLAELRAAHTVQIEETHRLHEATLLSLQQQVASLHEEKEMLKAEYATLAEQCRHIVEEKERVLEQSYGKMRELSARHADNLEKLERAHSQIEAQKGQMQDLEQVVIKAQTTMKNAQLHCEGRNAEIRKAQQHLAKKVKENAILRDLVERQKGHMSEFQEMIHKQKEELEQTRHHLSTHQVEEEKLQGLVHEQTRAVEILSKEWQDKYLTLQGIYEEQQGELAELRNMRDNYDQMVATVASLKTILGKSAES